MKENIPHRTRQPMRPLAEILRELIVTVSASRLGLFHTCRLRFFFRHVLGLTRPMAAALHLGATVHETLRVWNRARWRQQEIPSWGSLYASYEEAWIMAQAHESVAWENPADQDQQKQLGWRLLETFFRETTIKANQKPEAVEVRVEADLAAHGLLRPREARRQTPPAPQAGQRGRGHQPPGFARGCAGQHRP